MRPGSLAGSLAELGPYFAIEVHEPAAPRSAPWLPLADLLHEPAVLTARIGQVREGLTIAATAAGQPPCQVEFRVAASVAHLGLAARLLAPVLGAEALGGVLLMEPDRAWWVPELGGPFRLSVPAPALTPAAPRSGPRPTAGLGSVQQPAAPGSGPRPAAGLESVHRPAAGPGSVHRPAAPGRGRPASGACRDLLAGPVTELVAAVAARSVSPRILWGNVASAISGAATMIAAARPDLAGPARAAATTALQFPALASAADGPPGTSAFRRRSCCLIYRLSGEPGTALCGDCVLDTRPGHAGPAR